VGALVAGLAAREAATAGAGSVGRTREFWGVRDGSGVWGAGARSDAGGLADAHGNMNEVQGDAAALSALRRATLGGAAALGLSAVTGSIEVDKAADLVCFNLSALSCQPNAQRPADAVVFGATRNHVSDVWTSGRAAVSDGHLLTFDEQELLALAQRWAARLLTGGKS
jgi:5-methylthioadenosine/S-adenosylhomocysteine deaminase